MISCLAPVKNRTIMTNHFSWLHAQEMRFWAFWHQLFTRQIFFREVHRSKWQSPRLENRLLDFKLILFFSGICSDMSLPITVLVYWFSLTALETLVRNVRIKILLKWAFYQLFSCSFVHVFFYFRCYSCILWLWWWSIMFFSTLQIVLHYLLLLIKCV